MPPPSRGARHTRRPAHVLHLLLLVLIPLLLLPAGLDARENRGPTTAIDVAPGVSHIPPAAKAVAPARPEMPAQVTCELDVVVWLGTFFSAHQDMFDVLMPRAVEKYNAERKRKCTTYLEEVNDHLRFFQNATSGPAKPATVDDMAHQIDALVAGLTMVLSKREGLEFAIRDLQLFTPAFSGNMFAEYGTGADPEELVALRVKQCAAGLTTQDRKWNSFKKGLFVSPNPQVEAMHHLDVQDSVAHPFLSKQSKLAGNIPGTDALLDFYRENLLRKLMQGASKRPLNVSSSNTGGGQMDSDSEQSAALSESSDPVGVAIIERKPAPVVESPNVPELKKPNVPYSATQTTLEPGKQTAPVLEKQTALEPEGQTIPALIQQTVPEPTEEIDASTSLDAAISLDAVALPRDEDNVLYAVAAKDARTAARVAQVVRKMLKIQVGRMDASDPAAPLPADSVAHGVLGAFMRRLSRTAYGRVAEYCPRSRGAADLLGDVLNGGTLLCDAERAKIGEGNADDDWDAVIESALLLSDKPASSSLDSETSGYELPETDAALADIVNLGAAVNTTVSSTIGTQTGSFDVSAALDAAIAGDARNTFNSVPTGTPPSMLDWQGIFGTFIDTPGAGQAHPQVSFGNISASNTGAAVVSPAVESVSFGSMGDIESSAASVTNAESAHTDRIDGPAVAPSDQVNAAKSGGTQERQGVNTAPGPARHTDGADRRLTVLSSFRRELRGVAGDVPWRGRVGGYVARSAAGDIVHHICASRGTASGAGASALRSDLGALTRVFVRDPALGVPHHPLDAAGAVAVCGCAPGAVAVRPEFRVHASGLFEATRVFVALSGGTAAGVDGRRRVSGVRRVAFEAAASAQVLSAIRAFLRYGGAHDSSLSGAHGKKRAQYSGGPRGILRGSPRQKANAQTRRPSMRALMDQSLFERRCAHTARGTLRPSSLRFFFSPACAQCVSEQAARDESDCNACRGSGRRAQSAPGAAEDAPGPPDDVFRALRARSAAELLEAALWDGELLGDEDFLLDPDIRGAHAAARAKHLEAIKQGEAAQTQADAKKKSRSKNKSERAQKTHREPKAAVVPTSGGGVSQAVRSGPKKNALDPRTATIILIAVLCAAFVTVSAFVVLQMRTLRQLKAPPVSPVSDASVDAPAHVAASSAASLRTLGGNTTDRCASASSGASCADGDALDGEAAVSGGAGGAQASSSARRRGSVQPVSYL